MKIKVGITGGIGSGKSYVCQLLHTLGNIPIYSCDDEAKRLNEESPIIRRKLTELVGPQVYSKDGLLNRTELAAYLFANAEHARQINAIVHPIVKEDFLRWAEQQESEVVALEAALLFEAGFQDSLDYTILVTAPEELRIRRVLQRDHTTREAINRRIRVQSTDEQKKILADFILENDEVKPLKEEINKLLVFFRDKTL